MKEGTIARSRTLELWPVTATKPRTPAPSSIVHIGMHSATVHVELTAATIVPRR